MAVNSSLNSSVHRPLDCNGIFIFTALYVAYILLLPLFSFVFYVGYQRWRKWRSVAATAMTSHSDVVTFHMVVLELIGVLGSTFYCYGVYADQPFVMNLGLGIFGTITPGQALFHLLTCVERYLAVVHPITYLGLRQAGGVRIRNISIGCVWLLCFVTGGLAQFFCFKLISSIMLVVFSSFVVSFFSLCALYVLIRPGPGEVGGNRERVDQSKQRAFHTIMAIMGALLLKFLGTLVSTAVYISEVLGSCDNYVMLWSVGWFAFTSSLVLPLLFLHRAGKLPGCNHNTESV